MKSFAERFKDGLASIERERILSFGFEHVDYIELDLCFATISKNDANAPVGPSSMIATLKNINPSLPMVAIGGITEQY